MWRKRKGGAHKYRASGAIVEALEPRRLLSVSLNMGGTESAVPGTVAALDGASHPYAWETETPMAVNPKKPLNVVAAFTVLVSPGYTAIAVYASFDGGVTFPHQLHLTRGGVDPSIAFDQNGNLFISFISNPASLSYGQLIVEISHDGGVTFSQTGADEVVYSDPNPLDKDSIGIGLDPMSTDPVTGGKDQALYATFNYSANKLIGWDIDSTGHLYGTMKFTTAGFPGWGPPVVDPSGNVFMAGGINPVQVERLPLGLWNTQTFDNTVSLPSNPYGAPYLTAVPAAPDRGIFVSPVLDVDSSGNLDLAYVSQDDVFQAVADPNLNNRMINTVQTAKAHVVVSQCTNPTAGTPTWSTPTPVDPGGTPLQFHPAISVDRTAGSIDVFYLTTDGTNDSTGETVLPRLATFTASSGWTHAQLSSTGSNAYAYDALDPTNIYLPDYAEYDGLAVHDGSAHAAWTSYTGGSYYVYGANASFASSTSGNVLEINSSAAATISPDPNNSSYLEVRINGQIAFDGLMSTINTIKVDSGTSATLAVDLNDTSLGLDVFGTVTMNVTQHLGSLQIEAASAATPQVTLVQSPAPNNLVLYVNSLTMLPVNAPTGKLDMTNNSLVINYGQGNPSPDATVRNDLLAGRGTTSTGWNATAGITTSAPTDKYTTLGYVDRGNGKELVMYTLAGDLNLDGKVNNVDYYTFNKFYGTTSGGIWDEGDIDYNGKIDSADYFLFSHNFGNHIGGSPPPAAPVNGSGLSASSSLIMTAAFVEATREICAANPSFEQALLDSFGYSPTIEDQLKQALGLE